MARRRALFDPEVFLKTVFARASHPMNPGPRGVGFCERRSACPTRLWHAAGLCSLQPGVQRCGLPARLGPCRTRGKGSVMVPGGPHTQPQNACAALRHLPARRGMVLVVSSEGFSPDCPATGPFPTRYAAYRHAMNAVMINA
jgi:hypothetical protein